MWIRAFLSMAKGEQKPLPESTYKFMDVPSPKLQHPKDPAAVFSL